MGHKVGMQTVPSVAGLGLLWLGRYRSAAGVVVCAAFVLSGFELSSPPRFAQLGLLGALFLAAPALVRRLAESERKRALSLLSIDTALLTAALALSGGPANPLSGLYVVQVVYATLLAGRRGAVLLSLLTLLGFAGLFVVPGTGHHHGHHGAFANHLYGMLATYALTALLLASAVAGLVRALEERTQALNLLRQREARHLRLGALNTLAAGAAHGLGTPLGAITLAAEQGVADATAADSRAQFALIQSQAEHCRGLINDMRRASGDLGGEAPQSTSLTELATALREAAPQLELRGWDTALRLSLPKRSFIRTLTDLYTNSVEAGATQVSLEAQPTATQLCFRLRDNGQGFEAGLDQDPTEPFVSTKGAGRGLGLFLARSLMETLGGSLRIERNRSEGAELVLELPRPHTS